MSKETECSDPPKEENKCQHHKGGNTVKKEKKKGGQCGHGGLSFNLGEMQHPSFWASRLKLFDEYYAAQVASYPSKKAPIKISLPDGKVIDGTAWETTPHDIAKSLSNSLSDKVIVAKVNGNVWDSRRPFEKDSNLELLTWDDPDAQQVFWHSSAHVLGYALERGFDCHLSIGPPLADGGFFYEGDTNRPVTEGDYPLLHSAMGELVKQKVPFLRLVASKEQAMEMFGYSDLKRKILNSKVPDGTTLTIYKCGSLIDPCRGPHVPDTGRIKAYAVTKNSSSYFEGNAENAILQRVYGMSFPQEKMLKEWQYIQEEAAKRDHRVIGKQQDLFGFHEVSPGSAFWLPHGARIYNTLIEFVRKQYRRRGFEEVISPNIFNSKLWLVSGHWQHYKDAMFRTSCEHEEYAMKPMNCPGHCILFNMRPHSYKELPIRLAEFGVLHRNELSGTLTGLTRVRRFQQDDAHIFCRMDQIEEEMLGALDFLSMIYGVFDFKFFLKLSTRPDNALGSQKMWDVAETKLSNALNHYCGIPAVVPDPNKTDATFVYDGTPDTMKKLKAYQRKQAKAKGETEKPSVVAPWELNPGDGAFYGPKIDICVEDALRRKHQCATIQLDFSLPQRFGLKYTLASASDEANQFEESLIDVAAAEQLEKENGTCGNGVHVDPQPLSEEEIVSQAARDMKIDRTLDANQARPVMIHRAIFGSIERCVAILCEHYGGKWPFWMSPRQVVVIPVTKDAEAFARSVKEEIFGAGFFCDLDDSSGTLEKKIRNSQLAQYNFILVCGEKEMEERQVDVRTRDNTRHGRKTVKEVRVWMQELADTFSNDF